MGKIKEVVRIPTLGTPKQKPTSTTRQEQKKLLPFQDGLTNVQELANLIERLE